MANLWNFAGQVGFAWIGMVDRGTPTGFAGTTKYTGEVPATSSRGMGCFITTEGATMRKTLLALAAIAALATTATAPAEARGGRNAAIGFGIAAGALGAAAATSAYNSGYGYGPQYGYNDGPYYDTSPHVYRRGFHHYDNW
jgi:hypothetical protein